MRKAHVIANRVGRWQGGVERKKKDGLNSKFNAAPRAIVTARAGASLNLISRIRCSDQMALLLGRSVATGRLRRRSAPPAQPRDLRRETWRATDSPRRWLPRVTKDRTIYRGEAVSRSFRQSSRRRPLSSVVGHSGGRRRDGIRHQVDHTETTEPVPAVEHREQHNLRGGGHFFENHHR